MWCLTVIVTPEESRIAVFNSGTLIGFKGLTENGGHIKPDSIKGLSELWKNVQKKAKKNITSDTINRIIPIFNPAWTYLVWCPIIVLSRITSRHQAAETITIIPTEI